MTLSSQPKRADHRLSRRAFLKASGAAGAAVALGACAPRGEGPHGSGRAQLVYQDWRTDWFPGLAQRMLAQFHDRHPEIQVFFTMDPEDLGDAMLAEFSAGTAPDVVDGCCDFFPEWAQLGHLLDLRPFVEADLDRATINDWDPAQYEALFTADGRQFALPKYHGALGLFYNKDLLDAAGVSYPDPTWSHGDYREAMVRLARDRDDDGRNDVFGSMVDIGWERLQVHVNGWGGHFVDPQDPRRSWMAHPETLAALEWVRGRMWDDRVMASFVDVQNLSTRQAFIQERLAMVEDGSWALKDILEGARFRIGVAPFPAGPERRVTLATTDGFGIYAGTRYPEAAWELLKFLIGREYGRAMAETHLLQPARESLVDEWASLVRQAYPEATRGMELEAFAEGHRQGYSVTAEIFADMKSAREFTEPAWQRIFTLGLDPVDEMVQVSANIELSQPTGS
jgi:multiple sugar transport system substrate-binding protein